jgi:anti-anti-sigma factor
MEISIREVEGVNILDFSGNLDTNTSPAAESEINQLLEAGSKKILFNFSELNYISSSGLRVLLGTKKKLNVSGGTMQLCNLNSLVQEVFDISGFAGILTLASDEAAALAAF